MFATHFFVSDGTSHVRGTNSTDLWSCASDAKDGARIIRRQIYMIDLFAKISFEHFMACKMW